MMEYLRQNVEPVEIEYVPDEHDEKRDFQPSFWWWNRRYYLDDFVRCHNDPWHGNAEFPERIHGYEANNWVNPLYIEILDGEKVNIFEYKKVEY